MRLASIALILLLASPAWSASITIVPLTDNTQCGGIGGTNCNQNGSTDYGASWASIPGAAGTMPYIVGSTSTTLAIDAHVAIDGGGTATKTLLFNRTFRVDIVTDWEFSTWDVDLNASILGLHAFRGDGFGSSLGNQNDGSNSISTVVTTVDGTNYNIGGSSLTQDCSGTCETSTQFSNSTSPANVLTGVGSGSYFVTVDFDLSATTQDGCTGFVCSSASGGEESALLFGTENSTDQAVDNYSTWSRAIGPDGYNSTWTLNITSVPEPGTALLLMAGLGGLIAFGSRQRLA